MKVSYIVSMDVPLSAARLNYSNNPAYLFAEQPDCNQRKSMWLLLLEAGMALLILIFIVWWTMFSGRRPENKPRIEEQTDSKNDSN
ncbi:hypothetical protein Undi14_07835 [Undibacterium sp. 14-3-2]|uniref:hypothetical protein n=1 Tax=Undibacterium sp. 14-3-2 TaxID=2800129 RepID=UPI0019065482|nr:hypothetical protein [Undibacterium sp. 14-3-2]MBK1889946.1 hypothetical protein [Undibacterium sp. 14-3-2]